MAVLKFRDPVTGLFVPISGGAEEVAVSNAAPTDLNIELWVDPDAVGTAGISRDDADARYAALNVPIRVFANAAARDATIPAPVFGMMCQLQDTGTVQRHNGYVWVGDETWIATTGTNGWSGGNVFTRMDHTGLVIAAGRFTSAGSNSSSMATLPANHRPEKLILSAQYSLVGTTYKSVVLYIPEAGQTVAFYSNDAPASILEVGFALSWRANFLAAR